MKVALLANTNVGMLARQLSDRHDVIETPGFGAWAQALLDDRSPVWQAEPHALFLLLDGHELVHGSDSPADELSQQLALIEQVAVAHPATTFFVADLDLPAALRPLRAPAAERALERLWADGLEQLSALPNVCPFGLKGLVEEHGRTALYSPKMWYLGSQRFSMSGLGVLASEIERCLRALAGTRRKVLVLDCDNTLWGGVVGEEGALGVQLSDHKEGARYKDFQRGVKQLAELGVVLALASKNNPEDVAEVFATNPEMVLSDADIAARRVDWNPKASNLADLAGELSVGIDSFVFVDDSSFERESVAAAHPGVAVADFPKDTSKLPALVDALYREHFTLLESTAEDLRKTQMYRENAQRHRERRSAATLDDFLRTLKMRIHLKGFGSAVHERVHQLIQKTNQFNLTTRRHDRQVLAAMDADPSTRFLIASVADKYGDNGLVVVLIWHERAPTAIIDTFLMSCRVMGRHVEDQLLDLVESDLRTRGFTHLEAEYLPTQKNQPVAGLFDRLGYEVVETRPDGSKRYVLALGAPVTRAAFAEIVHDEEAP